jgi:hypothetical protein
MVENRRQASGKSIEDCGFRIAELIGQKRKVKEKKAQAKGQIYRIAIC